MKFYKNTKELPLYIDSVKLLDLSIDVFLQIPKLLQRTLADKSIDLETKLIRLIIIASKYPEKRIVSFRQFLEILGELETYIQLIINKSKFAQDNITRFLTLLEQLGKQSNAWLISTQSNQ